MIPINERLKKVATFVHHSKLADIGSDHAYLPLYLIENNKIKSAIAGEVVEGPYEAAVQNVDKYEHSDVIQVRLGNGLEVIRPGEVDCITICGMGGPLISEILLNGQSKLLNYPTLILQSNIHTAAVRETLYKIGYKIDEEVIMKEKKHIYEIVVANKNTDQSEINDKEITFGPKLLQSKNTAFVEKWERELNNLNSILEGIKDKASHQEKIEKINTQINTIKEVLYGENQ